MKKNSWITWLILLAAVFVVVETNPQIVPKLEKQVAQTTKKLKPYLYLTKVNLEQKLSGTTTKTTTESQVGKATTPIESPLQGMTTSRTYYYHFKDNVPENARQVFLDAVNTYNATGLVKLIPGQGQSNQNSITFFIYHKKIANIMSSNIELGNGGPSALQLNNYAINTAQAGLNMTYPTMSVKDSVAVHELGHALGLAHSSYTNSVMYPVDQGVSKLSQADLNGLKKIYNK
ncbi:M57 family metalloprotease [Companilactobacillus halodurans]|uniref:Matrixin family metalloprotease n=2 Tax=Bacillota TaxID=1239 RepID=A0A5P0ZQ83_9LACO|nr:M57 family metalloprotease [Companilactobacillus halodurans]MQS76279.1 matrixin family metalloprotease [Companilactobacillus halodurans]MQS96591.1 matrixin family metalloprotease [Companilactobacillus halodurans]